MNPSLKMMNKEERSRRLRLLLRERSGREQRAKFEKILRTYGEESTWSIISPLDSDYQADSLMKRFFELRESSGAVIGANLRSEAACQKVLGDLNDIKRVIVLPSEYDSVGYTIVDFTVLSNCLSKLLSADRCGDLFILTESLDRGYLIDEVDDIPEEKDVVRVGVVSEAG